MRSVLARVSAWCAARPAPVIALAVLIGILGVAGALALKPNGEVETIVDNDSEAFAATEELKEKFGDDPVFILLKGDLEQFVLTEDLQRILFLESCLAGTAPEGQVAEGISTPAVCEKIARDKPARVVYGPATFLNQVAEQATAQFQSQQQVAQQQAQAAGVAAYRAAIRNGLGAEEAQLAAQAAQQQVQRAFLGEALRLSSEYGLPPNPNPSIQDPTFVRPVVFDSRFTDARPKSKFAVFFPTDDSALITVRFRPELSEEERNDAIDDIREALTADVFQIRGSSYVVSGPPVLADGLTQELESQIQILLVAALIVMALVLALVFGPPFRLLPLGIGLLASAIAFGALSLFGGTLTMAVIAGLPVLIGLAVDYAIQLQARFTEARRGGSSPGRSAIEAAATGGPVVVTAAAATAAGFLVLVLSPIPMVRTFGLLLVGGLAIALVLALTAGLAILSMSGETASERRFGLRRGERRISRKGPAKSIARRFEASAWTARVRGGVSRVRAGVAQLGPRSLAASIAIPGKVIVASVVIAAAGWIAGTRTEIVSDFRELLPESLPALQDVSALEDTTGVSGYVDVAVEADEITDPAVVTWMRGYRERVLAEGGFGGDFPSCSDAETTICPAISLTDIVTDDQPTQERIEGVLSLLPAYFTQAFLETDQTTGEVGNTALLSFGIKTMPFDDQKALVDRMRDLTDPPGAKNDPPAGVNVEVLGLAVLAADANSALGSSRYVLTLVGLLAVALVLFAIYRSAKRALVPLIPVVLAPGWSALVLEGLGLQLNPMSATLGALVIAIATEFSVLLSSRYWEEREAGSSVGEALRLTYSRTGTAVIASGITAIAGFAVLALAAPAQAIFGGDAIRMLTEFGLVGVVDLIIALAGVLFVLPAALVWAERDFSGARAVAGRLRRPRFRRQATAAR